LVTRNWALNSLTNPRGDKTVFIFLHFEVPGVPSAAIYREHTRSCWLDCSSHFSSLFPWSNAGGAPPPFPKFFSCVGQPRCAHGRSVLLFNCQCLAFSPRGGAFMPTIKTRFQRFAQWGLSSVLPSEGSGSSGPRCFFSTDVRGSVVPRCRAHHGLLLSRVL